MPKADVVHLCEDDQMQFVITSLTTAHLDLIYGGAAINYLSVSENALQDALSRVTQAQREYYLPNPETFY